MDKAAAMPRLDFWYEFASSYSYPAAMRIEAVAASQGVAVRWRPFLLGPLFAAQGWRDSPFNIYPVKGRYMWRDLERICATLELPLQRPDPFPQNSLLAARVALALPEELRASFSRAVFSAEFGHGRPISDRALIGVKISKLGEDVLLTLARAESVANKAALKSACEEAQALGLTGAPACVTEGGEVFWGNDRVEQAVGWALGEGGSRQSADGSRP